MQTLPEISRRLLEKRGDLADTLKSQLIFWVAHIHAFPCANASLGTTAEKVLQSVVLGGLVWS